MRLWGTRPGRIAVVAGVLLTAGTLCGATAPEAAAERRAWIAEMKGAERGPFSRIRWFCKDGALLPPTPSACVSHGGGWQHGEWSATTTALRAQGYLVANVLAGIDADALVADPGFPEAYAQILVERFLVGADNGWIYRRAQYYRGAVQAEDERDGARALLLAMLQGPGWTGYRYPALRTGARLLPHGKDTASIQQVRDKAAALAALDPTFARLRAKIHGTPEARDAASVREHSTRSSRADLAAQYEALAAQIDLVYSGPSLPERLEQEAAVMTRAPWLQQTLRASARGIAAAPSPAARYAACASLLAALRDALPRVSTPSARLRLLDLSLAVETEAFRAGAELREPLRTMTRAERLSFLGAAGAAAYGTGHLNGRLRGELSRDLAPLSRDEASLGDYLVALKRMSLAPGWGTQALRYHFQDGMARLTELDPQADLFIQDQLRGSPLLLFSDVLDGLLRDANRLAGVHHKLYGRDVGVGLSALNPGLARGILNASPNMARLEQFRADGLYVLPETVADLPPLAGILTAGAGNPLSHVQLLARNLGIPNVAVDEELLAEVRTRDSRRVVLAVSPGGVVEVADDSPAWNPAFDDPASGGGELMIRPDLQKLDLTVRDFVPLERLRASDSGRIVGPKAAKLGELRRHFPEAVSRGVAIPFGLFREAVLDRPYGSTGQSTYEWMVSALSGDRGDASGLSRAGGRLRGPARAPLRPHSDERPRERLPRPAARGDGEHLRPRLQGRRLRALRHQRGGPSRIHGGRAQPDRSERRRLRGGGGRDPRGLGLALHGARLRLAPGPHEGSRERLSRRAPSRDGALRHLGGHGHAEPGVGGRERSLRGGQRGHGRRRGRPGRGVAARRHPGR